MTKTDEFVAKIEQLDPHLQVQKYKDLYNYGKVDMIVWYVTDNDFKLPFVTFAYACGTPIVKTERELLEILEKDDLVLYSKVIKLCIDYFFPLLFKKKA